MTYYIFLFFTVQYRYCTVHYITSEYINPNTSLTLYKKHGKCSNITALDTFFGVPVRYVRTVCHCTVHILQSDVKKISQLRI